MFLCLVVSYTTHYLGNASKKASKLPQKDDIDLNHDERENTRRRPRTSRYRSYWSSIDHFFVGSHNNTFFKISLRMRAVGAQATSIDSDTTSQRYYYVLEQSRITNKNHPIESDLHFLFLVVRRETFVT